MKYEKVRELCINWEAISHLGHVERNLGLSPYGAETTPAEWSQNRHAVPQSGITLRIFSLSVKKAMLKMTPWVDFHRLDQLSQQMHNSEKLFICELITIVSTFIILITWFYLFGPEQYYVFDPYIDTEMSKGYIPAKFDEIQIGMDKSEVLEIIGSPLFIRIDSSENEIKEIFDYTNDGKILHEKMSWYMSNDYAWYRSIIQFDNHNKVIDINKGWSYD